MLQSYLERAQHAMQGGDVGSSAAAEVIEGEAERMAEIVRKIGKITKYETKSYVGKQKILDLDRASEEGVPAAEPVSPSTSRTPAAEPSRQRLNMNKRSTPLSCTR